jgi:hypothetical protein
LLCSNCVFGKGDHKYHKITPVDRCEDRLHGQIAKMASGVLREAEILGTAADMMLDYVASEEAELHKVLNLLTVRYQEAQLRL